MKLIKSILLIIVLSLVTSCSNNMKPEDFKNTEPTLLIEEYFNGKVKAWGILQDRNGKVTRQFKANLIGSFNDNIITLDEDFYWTDGEKQKRTWKIKKIDNNEVSKEKGELEVGELLVDTYVKPLIEKEKQKNK